MNNSITAIADSGRSDGRIEAVEAENLRLREAVAARDSFLAVAAHELRNPMTPILGRVTLLRRAVSRGGASPDHIAASLERIEQLVVQFIKRATTLLDVARAEADCMPVEQVAIDVSQLVRDLLETYRPAAIHAGASLEAQVPDVLIARGDRLALEQVLENLITNAIKYGDASPIRIDAEAVPERGMVIVRVVDHGPGIAAHQQARIFERYERGPRPGTEVAGFGVGLWIVRRLCQSMGGSVDVTSVPGSGATFSVTLPLMSPPDSP